MIPSPRGRGSRGGGDFISTLTLALSRRREREVMIFLSFVGGQAAMTIALAIALHPQKKGRMVGREEGWMILKYGPDCRVSPEFRVQKLPD